MLKYGSIAEERAGEREGGRAGELAETFSSPALPLSRSPALSSAIRNRIVLHL